MMRLKPSEIMFSQETVNNYFDKRSEHSGRLIGETLDDICEGRCSIDDIPTIRVMQRNGKWVTADNRRLWVFRELERLGKCDEISVCKTFYINPNKLNSCNGGVSVRVRRYAGGRWHNKPSAKKIRSPISNTNSGYKSQYSTPQAKENSEPYITSSVKSERQRVRQDWFDKGDRDGYATSHTPATAFAGTLHNVTGESKEPYSRNPDGKLYQNQYSSRIESCRNIYKDTQLQTRERREASGVSSSYIQRTPARGYRNPGGIIQEVQQSTSKSSIQIKSRSDVVYPRDVGKDTQLQTRERREDSGVSSSYIQRTPARDYRNPGGIIQEVQQSTPKSSIQTKSRSDVVYPRDVKWEEFPHDRAPVCQQNRADPVRVNMHNNEFNEQSDEHCPCVIL